MFTFFKNEIPTTNAKCNFTTQMHTTEYLQNQNRLLLAFTGCLGDKYRERTAYFSSPLDFVLHSRDYETLSWYAQRAAISLCFICLESGANIGTTCLFPRQRNLSVFCSSQARVLYIRETGATALKSCVQ